jgi:hypothetical protein
MGLIARGTNFAVAGLQFLGPSIWPPGNGKRPDDELINGQWFNCSCICNEDSRQILSLGLRELPVCQTQRGYHALKRAWNLALGISSVWLFLSFICSSKGQTSRLYGGNASIHSQFALAFPLASKMCVCVFARVYVCVVDLIELNP